MRSSCLIASARAPFIAGILAWDGVGVGVEAGRLPEKARVGRSGEKGKGEGEERKKREV